MDVSVLIPTYGRAAKLGRCLERLARQTYDHARFEVIVGVDGRPEGAGSGVDEAADAAHELAARTTGSMRAVVHQFEHAGPGATRNKLFEHARGRVILLLNDDVLPEPDLIEAHAREHTGGECGAKVVLGAAPWVVPVHGEDTLFDRLIRETSMVFFYDRMDAALARGEVGREHDWGFRHAWTLNLSLRREAWEAVGGFDERLRFACYEDLEFGYRVCGARGERARLVYAPEAVVRHDHRIAAEDYLRREAMMGRAAWEFAGACPDCSRAVFGRDIRSKDEVAYSREFVAREAATIERVRESFAAWARMPSSAVGGEHAAGIIRGLYEQHLMLKRWTWRKGLVEAADSTVAHGPSPLSAAR